MAVLNNIFKARTNIKHTVLTKTKLNTHYFQQQTYISVAEAIESLFDTCSLAFNSVLLTCHIATCMQTADSAVTIFQKQIKKINYAKFGQYFNLLTQQKVLYFKIRLCKPIQVELTSELKGLRVLVRVISQQYEVFKLKDGKIPPFSRNP